MEKFRIMRLEVDSFKGIKARTVDAFGKHVVIEGPNGAGKTSILDALMFALQGQKRGTDTPVHRGCDEAVVKLTLSDGEQTVQIKRTVDAAGTKTLLAKRTDGKPLNCSASAFVETLLSKYAADPVAFLQLRPAEQVDVILKSCNVKVPVDEVEMIIGSRPPVADDDTAYSYLMKLSADKTGLYYETRKDAAKEVQQKESALQDALELLNRLPAVEVEKTTEKCLAEIERLQEEQKSYITLHARALNAKAEVSRSQKDIFSAKRRFDDLVKEVKDAEEAVARAIARRDGQGATVSALEASHEVLLSTEAIATLSLPEAKTFATNTAHDAAMADAKAALSLARIQEQRAAERKTVVDSIRRITDELAAVKEWHSEVDGQLAKLRLLRHDCLKNADLGVNGLGIGEGTPTLGDVPLSSCSTGEQLKVAFAVAIKQHPNLAMLRVDEGERLDQRSRDQMFNMADEAGMQVVMAAVKDCCELTINITE